MKIHILKSVFKWMSKMSFVEGVYILYVTGYNDVLIISIFISIIGWTIESTL